METRVSLVQVQLLVQGQVFLLHVESVQCCWFCQSCNVFFQTKMFFLISSIKPKNVFHHFHRFNEVVNVTEIITDFNPVFKSCIKEIINVSDRPQIQIRSSDPPQILIRSSSDPQILGVELTPYFSVIEGDTAQTCWNTHQL